MKFNLRPVEERNPFEDWKQTGLGPSVLLKNINPHHKDGMHQIDWKTVKELIKTGEYSRIDVGLAEDWSATHAAIHIKDGKVDKIEQDCYGASIWATPAVKLYDLNGEVIGLFECSIPGNKTKIPDNLFD